MAAFMRACICRFVISKPQVTKLSVSRPVKCIERLYLQRTLSRPCSYVTNQGEQQQQVFRTKIVTHDDSELQDYVASVFIGKGGSNIIKFTSDCKVDVIDGNIWVSGKDAEGFEKTVEKVTTEVQRIKDSILPICEKVLTDENEDIHSSICKQLVGNQGVAIRKMISEAGHDVKIQIPRYDRSNHILVLGSDQEAVNKTVERAKQEIETLKDKMPHSRKLFTDKVATIHNGICGRIIGKGGANLNRIRSEVGHNFDLDVHDQHLVIFGSEAEVDKVAEIMQKEIEELKKEMLETFSGKVLTDEKDLIHDRICGKLIGKGGENLKRIRSESGLRFRLETSNGYVHVSGVEPEEVKRAVEKIKEEIQKIKSEDLPFSKMNLPFSEKVSTDENENVHHRICGSIIGERGGNLNRIRLESGINFEMQTGQGEVIISGTDAEAVKLAADKIQQIVKRIKNQGLHTHSEKVLTDEDESAHSQICAMLIGKGGEKLNRIRSQSGTQFGLEIGDGYVLVVGSDAEMVKKATEMVQLEVQRIRSDVKLPFSEKVSTDENILIHQKICRLLIGKGGQNVNRLNSEIGLAFNLNCMKQKAGHISVIGADEDVIKKAAERVKEEVERIKKENILPFCEKVTLNGDEEMKSRICSMIIGKGGERFERFKYESKLDFELLVPSKDQEADFLLVSGADAEVVQEAALKLEQEIGRIKDILNRDVELAF